MQLKMESTKRQNFHVHQAKCTRGVGARHGCTWKWATACCDSTTPRLCTCKKSPGKRPEGKIRRAQELKSFYSPCVLFNARSIKSRDKRLELAELLASQKYLILALSETWLNVTVTDHMLTSHPSTCTAYPYKVFRKDRKEKVYGGVAILVHNSISVCTVNIPQVYEALEMIVLDLCINVRPQRLICVYRPPNGTRERV